jgi:hypothetical protein
MGTADQRGAPVADLLNLGPVSARWLAAIGVRTRADLAAIGAVECYRILKGHGYRVSLNLVYALEGALRGVRWNALPPAVRDDLKRRARQ